MTGLPAHKDTPTSQILAAEVPFRHRHKLWLRQEPRFKILYRFFYSLRLKLRRCSGFMRPWVAIWRASAYIDEGPFGCALAVDYSRK